MLDDGNQQSRSFAFHSSFIKSFCIGIAISLAERIFTCECGFSADRDLNAALNLNQYGLDTLQPRP
ncbi:zinc ribbon domain-containing protein [Chromatium okenii]|uniref:Cas12f1-like TNB domain-containing protein n=1 Tax=Chromatium okenii TaxID=61644 RepID=A0A2S7XTF7_9GAMM|nr:hypothetical protein CXB77_03150 [Chromatium okenii]